VLADGAARQVPAHGIRVARQREEICRGTQMRLARLGYPVGDVDGELGPRTRSAVQHFQEHRGFRPTGRLDPQTLAALDIDTSTSGATSGSPR
jgi:peptidoglycan hydrolase-like protein with peptidoglycan-binding domain